MSACGARLSDMVGLAPVTHAAPVPANPKFLPLARTSQTIGVPPTRRFDHVLWNFNALQVGKFPSSEGDDGSPPPHRSLPA
jgi:hypothetical protein